MSASNAAILFRNLADEGDITVSSSADLLTGRMLQDVHVGRKWRSVGDSAYIIVDLNGSFQIDTIALIGSNLRGASTTRVRASTADSSGLAGDAFDTGSITGKANPEYLPWVTLMPEPKTARYVRIDAADAGLPYIQAGRLVVGLRHTFAINFSYGWTFGRTDRSRRTESRGGQLFIDKNNKYRTLDVRFDFLSEAERYGFAEDIDRLNGESDDVLFIVNPASTTLWRDSIWGLISDVEPFSQSLMTHPPLFSKTFNIRERL